MERFWLVQSAVVHRTGGTEQHRWCKPCAREGRKKEAGAGKDLLRDRLTATANGLRAASPTWARPERRAQAVGRCG